MLTANHFYLLALEKISRLVNAHGPDLLFNLTKDCIYVPSDRRILSECFCCRIHCPGCASIDDGLDPENLDRLSPLLRRFAPEHRACPACRSTTHNHLRSLLAADRR